MNIYVASSWRCSLQPTVVSILRGLGFEVYDFRNPAPGNIGFHWSEVDPAWQSWNTVEYVKGLRHPVAEKGFECDWQAMLKADACVLVLPCGRSAHLEAGYFIGAKKPVFIYVADLVEPELMYKMATGVYGNLAELIEDLKQAERAQGQHITKGLAAPGLQPVGPNALL